MTTDQTTDQTTTITIEVDPTRYLELLDRTDEEDIRDQLVANLPNVLDVPAIVDLYAEPGRATSEQEHTYWHRGEHTGTLLDVDQTVAGMLDWYGDAWRSWPTDIIADVAAAMVTRAAPEVDAFHAARLADDKTWLRSLVEQRGRAWILERLDTLDPSEAQ